MPRKCAEFPLLKHLRLVQTSVRNVTAQSCFTHFYNFLEVIHITNASEQAVSKLVAAVILRV